VRVQAAVLESFDLRTLSGRHYAISLLPRFPAVSVTAGWDPRQRNPGQLRRLAEPASSPRHMMKGG
jgi:hypothetical protein